MADEFRSIDMSGTMALAREIDRTGRETGLPYVAVSADISDPSPMIGPDGKPLAETVFRWVNPEVVYWKDRAFALRSGLLGIVRVCAEPFYYKGGRMHSWRQIRVLDVANETLDPEVYVAHRIASAITCPVHSPMGAIGAVVWATEDASVDVAEVFHRRAVDMQALALKFLSSYRDTSAVQLPAAPVEFTRREIQCLKWAAAGKTDSEIATIMNVSVPTIRFHLTNASRKLGVSGRSQTVRLATNLGYIGAASAG